MLDRLRRLASLSRRNVPSNARPLNEKGDSINEKIGAIKLQMPFDNDSDTDSINSEEFSCDEKHEPGLMTDKDGANRLRDIAPLIEFLKTIQSKYADVKAKSSLTLAQQLQSPQPPNAKWAQLTKKVLKLSDELFKLGDDLNQNVQRGEEVTTLCKYRIQLLRDLTNAEPVKHQRQLSDELQILAYRLFKKENQGERLSSQLEAIVLLRQCADREGTKRRRRMLARALGTYAEYLRLAGKSYEANVAEDECLGIFRDYLKEGFIRHNIDNTTLDPQVHNGSQNPPRFEPIVIFDRVLHVAHLQLLRHVREIFQRYPGVQIYRLACALERSSSSHHDAGDDALAVERSKEAVGLYRMLVKYDASFTHKLSGALCKLAEMLQTAGDFGNAVTASEEAVEIDRGVGKDKLSRHNLALSLCRLGQCQAASKSFDLAYSTTTEAIDITGQLMRESPKDSNPQHYHITALVHYSEVRSIGWLNESQRSEERLLEAYNATAEGLALRRKMITEKPSKWKPSYLAIALEHHSVPLRLSGKHDEAIAITTEALGIWRKIYDESPATYRQNVAVSLAVHRDAFSSAGKYRDALDAVNEEIVLFEALKADSGDHWIYEKRLERAIQWRDYLNSKFGGHVKESSRICSRSKKENDESEV